MGSRASVDHPDRDARAVACGRCLVEMPEAIVDREIDRVERDLRLGPDLENFPKAAPEAAVGIGVYALERWGLTRKLQSHHPLLVAHPLGSATPSEVREGDDMHPLAWPAIGTRHPGEERLGPRREQLQLRFQAQPLRLRRIEDLGDDPQTRLRRTQRSERSRSDL